MICPIPAQNRHFSHSTFPQSIVDINDVVKDSAWEDINVAAGRPAKLPATTTDANKPMFSKPLDWAPSARAMRALALKELDFANRQTSEVGPYGTIEGLVFLNGCVVTAWSSVVGRLGKREAA
jgi:hypothetical protein